MSTWREQQELIEILEGKLRDKPDDLDVAKELWRSLGAGVIDLRSGADLVRILRIPAIEKEDGVFFLAHEYRELTARTGEVPMPTLFDKALTKAVVSASDKVGSEHVVWLLSKLHHR